MDISEIAELVWQYSHSIKFGGDDVWDSNLFTSSWDIKRKTNSPWRSYKSGWYWFLADLSIESLKALKRPSTLPLKGCDFGQTALANWSTFGPELLCRTREDGLLVVYNGHENSVCDRVRSHFILKNDRTGALGLRHFLLHERRWELKVFSAPCLTSIPTTHRSKVETLMASKSGRCAVESAWRVSHGWPALCKE